MVLICVLCESSHLISEPALLAYLQGSIEGLFCDECDRAEVYLTQRIFNDLSLGNQEQPIDLSRRRPAIDPVLNESNARPGSNSAVSEGTINPGPNLSPEPRVYIEPNVYPNPNPNPNIGPNSPDLNSIEVAINLTTRNRGVRDRPSSSGNGKYWRSWL